MHVETISEGKAGTLTQCLGIAQLLSPDVSSIVVDREPLSGRVMSALLRFTRPGKEPRFVISCGRRAERPALALKRRFGQRPIAVHLQRPQLEPNGFDRTYISRHDWRPEFAERPNYRKMVGVPNRITHELLQGFEDEALHRFGVMGGPYAVVLIGGSNGAYLYDDGVLARIGDTIKDLAAAGWSVLATTSRRSSDETLAYLLGLRSPRVFVWDRIGENPLMPFFAIADAFLVTKDSITMPCEALATGKPVYIVDLPAIAGDKHDKFERFHRDMTVDLGLTRPYRGDLEPYPYKPLREAARIAEELSTAFVSASQG